MDFFYEFHTLYYFQFSEAVRTQKTEISSDLKSARQILVETVEIFSYESNVHRTKKD